MTDNESIVTKFKSKIIKFIGVLFVLALLWLGIKSLLVIHYVTPKNFQTYFSEGTEGRSFQITLLPNNEILMWYVNSSTASNQIILFKVDGVCGKKLVGRLWYIDHPDILLAYKIYPPNTNPVILDLTCLNKIIVGSERDSFPNKGSTVSEIVLFRKDAIFFNDTWFHRMPTDMDLLHVHLSLLKEE